MKVQKRRGQGGVGKNIVGEVLNLSQEIGILTAMNSPLIQRLKWHSRSHKNTVIS